MIRHKLALNTQTHFQKRQFWHGIFGRKPSLEELSEQRDSFLFLSIAPGITKNDSSSTAPEAVSQLLNGCAAQVEGQVLKWEG
jgi:hypothetical protein